MMSKVTELCQNVKHVGVFCVINLNLLGIFLMLKYRGYTSWGGRGREVYLSIIYTNVCV